MSRDEKLITKFLARPKAFTYNELRRMLKGLGYVETQQGKTSGSRVAFYNNESEHIIRLHKPHAGNELKRYQIDMIREELEGKNLL